MLRTHWCPTVSIPSEWSLAFCPSRCKDLTLAPGSFLFLPMQGKPSTSTAGTPPDTPAGTAWLQRAWWSSDKCNMSSGQREGIPEWNARTTQLLAQAISCCGPDGDNNVAGKTTLDKRHMWGAEAGRGRSNVSKRRKCYGEPNETAGRGLLHVPGIWPSTDFTFVLWREIKTLVHSAHGPKNFGNKPSCCPLLEPALLLQGRFAIQRQLGKSERKNLNLLSVFWRPSS